MIWRDSSIHKYSLIKAKLQLQNNDPKLQTKNKNDLKYLLYYNYKIMDNELTNTKTRAILPTTSCTEVTTRTTEEHITSSSDVVVVCSDKKLSQYQQ